MKRLFRNIKLLIGPLKNSSVWQPLATDPAFRNANNCQYQKEKGYLSVWWPSMCCVCSRKSRASSWYLLCSEGSFTWNYQCLGGKFLRVFILVIIFLILKMVEHRRNKAWWNEGQLLMAHVSLTWAKVFRFRNDRRFGIWKLFALQSYALRTSGRLSQDVTYSNDWIPSRVIVV